MINFCNYIINYKVINMEYIKFDINDCKDCYSCLRNCPVKAIKFINKKDK